MNKAEKSLTQNTKLSVIDNILKTHAEHTTLTYNQMSKYKKTPYNQGV